MATTNEPTNLQANNEQETEMSKEQRIAIRRERIMAKKEEKGTGRGRLEGELLINN